MSSVVRPTRSRSCFVWSISAAWTPHCVSRCGLSSWDITSLEWLKQRGRRFVISSIMALAPEHLPPEPLTLDSSPFTPGGWTGQTVLPTDHAWMAGLWGDCPPAGEGAARCSISKVFLCGEHGQLQSEDGPSWLHCQQWGDAVTHTDTMKRNKLFMLCKLQYIKLNLVNFTNKG